MTSLPLLALLAVVPPEAITLRLEVGRRQALVDGGERIDYLVVGSAVIVGGRAALPQNPATLLAVVPRHVLRASEGDQQLSCPPEPGSGKYPDGTRLAVTARWNNRGDDTRYPVTLRTSPSLTSSTLAVTESVCLVEVTLPAPAGGWLAREGLPRRRLPVAGEPLRVAGYNADRQRTELNATVCHVGDGDDNQIEFGAGQMCATPGFSGGAMIAQADTTVLGLYHDAAFGVSINAIIAAVKADHPAFVPWLAETTRPDWLTPRRRWPRRVLVGTGVVVAAATSLFLFRASDDVYDDLQQGRTSNFESDRTAGRRLAYAGYTTGAVAILGAAFFTALELGLF